MTRQIIITFIDDTKDWIDPIVDEKRDVVYTDTQLIINNGYQSYEYDLSVIKDVAIREI